MLYFAYSSTAVLYMPYLYRTVHCLRFDRLPIFQALSLTVGKISTGWRKAKTNLFPLKYHNTMTKDFAVAYLKERDIGYSY